MPTISSTLHNRLCECLLHCGPFTSDQALQAIFVDTRLSQWKAGLPEATSDVERVRFTIEYLSNKHNLAGEDGLVLLLFVLRDLTSPEDASHRELAQLAAELEQVAPIPDTPQWDAALARYREWVKRTYGTMRVLGKHEPVSVEGIYTDVYLLEQPTASRYTDLPSEKKSQRLNGLELVKQLDTQILVILGKPGAGKTTFLKHIALQAVTGQLDDCVPIFVALREWTDNDHLLDILAEPFTACDLADPRAYLEHLLQTGRALLLFDALDEMSEQARSAFIKMLERFSRRYLDCHILLTCRTAATPYQFERAKTVEVADFTDEQMRAFAANWFGEDTAKAEKFRRQIEQDERLRDLGRTPLLLGMLCLTFDERGDFPQKRADLYRQALDTLLVQWDESRNIERDAMRRAEIYHKLSLGQKHQLFAYVAYKTFEQGETFIPQERLERLITDYLVTIPNAPAWIDIDASAVLKTVEAQHGVLLEHTYQIYVFAHITFQEYFTAKFVVDDAGCESLKALLILEHIIDTRWYETLLLTASLLKDADEFFLYFQHALDRILVLDANVIRVINWAAHKTTMNSTPYKSAIVRGVYICLYEGFDSSLFSINLVKALDFARVLTFDSVHTLNLIRILDFFLRLTLDLKYALTQTLDINLAIALVRDQSCHSEMIFDISLLLTLLYTAYFSWRGNVEEVRQQTSTFTTFFAEVVTLSKYLPSSLLYSMLSSLSSPDAKADIATWETFDAELCDLALKFRGLRHRRELNSRQHTFLHWYLEGNKLLAKCLNVAHVTGRAAIEARLLLPPGYTEEA